MGKHLHMPTAIRIPPEWKERIAKIAEEWNSKPHAVVLSMIGSGLELHEAAIQREVGNYDPTKPCGDRVKDCTCEVIGEHGHCECKCGNSWTYEPGWVADTDGMKPHYNRGRARIEPKI